MRILVLCLDRVYTESGHKELYRQVAGMFTPCFETGELDDILILDAMEETKHFIIDTSLSHTPDLIEILNSVNSTMRRCTQKE